MSANPLLQPALLQGKALPSFPAIDPDHVVPAIQRLLNEQRQGIKQITATREAATFTTHILALEALGEALDNAWSPVSHLNSVANSAKLRKAYNAAREKLAAFAAEMGQNRELYETYDNSAKAEGFDQLPPAARKLIRDAVRDFRLSGVALEGQARQRFRQLSEELSQCASTFEENVLDATDAWTLHLDDDTRLDGIPERMQQMFAQAARARDLDGYLVTLQMPSFHAVMTYAADRTLREQVYRAFVTRASTGDTDNTTVMGELLAKRHEQARLLDYPNFAEYSLATKMAEDAVEVENFLTDLTQRARPRAEEEFADLEDFAARQLQIDDLKAWDTAFAAEKLKQARYRISDEDLKPYFPLPSVLDGLFDVAGKLFGVRFAQRDDVPVWHDDVRYFNVIDPQENVISGFYLDAYAREKKRGGAWMDVCRSRLAFADFQPQADSARLPVAFLTCNFSPPVGDDPALLTHDEVTTLFHEFGHGLHHMLTQVGLPSVAGISGVEWDAVEQPSQFLENWCWEKQALDNFARHFKTGEPIPEDMFERLLATRHFHAGLFLVRQLGFALFDLRLHRDYDPEDPADPMDVLNAVREEVAVVPAPDFNRFPHAFSHIFAGGYAAGYYSYLWAQVLAADAFGRFLEEGIFNAATGADFRDQILATGGSRPALESFVAFRGRQPTNDALLAQYGLIDTKAAA